MATDPSNLAHPSGAHVETSLPDGTLIVTDDNGWVQSVTRDGQEIPIVKAVRQAIVDAGYTDTSVPIADTAPVADVAPAATVATPAPTPPAVTEAVPAPAEAPAVASEAPAVASEAPAVASEAPAVASEAPAVASEAPAVASEAPAVADVAVQPQPEPSIAPHPDGQLTAPQPPVDPQARV